MSTTIGCTIDTEPMAKELRSISNHVNGTTAAVVGMQAAVIRANEEAADRVCDDVNRGFHALMSSQISQKIAKLQSDVDSHLMRLNQQTRQLLEIKRQMEKDYYRTAQRYGKIFDTINKELRIRVQELDQPIFKFAVNDVQKTNNRMHQLVGTVPVVSAEAITEAQQIVTSMVKKHGLDVLKAAKGFVGSMNEQRELTNRILLSNQKAITANLYAPVIVMEGESQHGVSNSVYLSNELFSKPNQTTVKGEVMQAANSFEWQKSEKNNEVNNEFVRLLSTSSTSNRVKNMIQQLMDKSENYQSL